MTRKEPPRSDLAAYLEELDEEDLRRVLAMGQARLRDREGPAVHGLMIANLGKGSLRVRAAADDERTLKAGASITLAPRSFSLRSGDPGPSGNRWLSPRARTILRLTIEGAAASGGKCRLDLASWRADCARIGAPELIVLTRLQEGEKAAADSLVSYLPSIELDLAEGDAADVIVIGRGPEDDAGRLVRRFFEEPPEPAEQMDAPGSKEDAIEDEERPSPGEAQ